LPAGAQGRLAIVAHGEPWVGELPVVVRNNTTQAVTEIRVRAVVTAGDGTRVVGSSRLLPYHVQPGEIAFGYVYFTSLKDVILPPRSPFKFLSVRASRRTSFRDLVVVRSSRLVQRVGPPPGYLDGQVVGVVRNAWPVRVRPETELVGCFTRTGRMLRDFTEGSDLSPMPPRATLPFRVIYVDPSECPVYVVAVAGRATR
jgi:hypothetical protein